MAPKAKGKAKCKAAKAKAKAKQLPRRLSKKQHVEVAESEPPVKKGSQSKPRKASSSKDPMPPEKKAKAESGDKSKPSGAGEDFAKEEVFKLLKMVSLRMMLGRRTLLLISLDDIWKIYKWPCWEKNQ